MTPSIEYQALVALTQPPSRSQPGDIWLCRRIGIVRVFNGHKRGSRRGTIYNNFHLYHFGKPSLYSRPCDWRDDDPNSCSLDPAMGDRTGEKWEYVGNIFDLLPFSSFGAPDTE